jgi:hypothetical protein
MINYLDNKNLNKLIILETNSLNSTLSIQKTLNKQILVFMKNFIGNIEIDSDIDFNDNDNCLYITKSANVLNKSNQNIASLKKLITALNDLNNLLPQKINPIILEAKFNLYNNDFNTTLTQVYANTKDIEEFLQQISLIDLSKLLPSEKSAVEKKEVECTDDTITTEDLNYSFIENTLIISEMNGTVTLPYQLDTVKEILLTDNKYKSLEDVIKREYTLPIKNYKLSAVARFREAYKLATKKEHLSKAKALALASELFANNNLHPAIITACKSLDELDIYLCCLEDDTLEDFHFFDIKYEIAPTIVKEVQTI